MHVIIEFKQLIGRSVSQKKASSVIDRYIKSIDTELSKFDNKYIRDMITQKILDPKIFVRNIIFNGRRHKYLTFIIGFNLTDPNFKTNIIIFINNIFDDPINIDGLMIRI